MALRNETLPSFLTGVSMDSSGNTIKNIVLNYTGTITLAELNAGKILVNPVVGRTLMVLRYYLRSNGTFLLGTGITLQDTNNTPVVVAMMAVAVLVTGAEITSEVAIANVTKGAGFKTPLTPDKGIAVKQDSAITAGTSVLISFDYMIV
jgi:hemolysin activation/secretion protein